MNRLSAGLKYGTFTTLLLWTLFPIYWMLVIATQESSDLFTEVSIFPRSLTLEHIFNIFVQDNYLGPLINSFIITVSSLLIVLVFGLSSAYVLGRRTFRSHYRIFKSSLMIWILLVRVLPPITFALPLYIMMNDAGLLNTKIPIIVAHVLVNLPLVIWFMMAFFYGVPGEIEESARMDGASEFMIFTKVMLPLVVPGIAAVTILSFMASWNEYLYSVIFIQSPDSFTIPLKLATLNSEQELTEWGKVAGGGLVSVLPVLLTAIFLQKHLISGLTAGAVKE
ncbi:multiple sugar transport system permease protein/trehalose/maltose transport system permease protein [Paenibacillus amylolyticus]|uniref:Multiple sugar transport system permease protein/trehalose/maltose transport system permease protein n=1 Tax=Paenibacillus amylolyticus TaxID=1451 RepID=A0AAP5LPX1_PAEAM|nr:carbohydrate ABC transporter permease [Paenibacillus amylolyticus]MDR6722944.1 multiple sugar transport system permease protein/trehalose/maltose transport system permease protein [Paenibacillus amylolyticus]